jgi:hypothetical protein
MYEYYYADNQKPQGPHTLGEIHDLQKDGIIDGETLIWRPGDTEWTKFSQLPEFIEQAVSTEEGVIAKALKETEHAPDSADAQKPIVEHSVEDAAEKKEEEAEEKVKRVSRHQLLRNIRKDLDALWDCQREALIAAVKDEELAEVYQATRKQNKEIYKRIEETTILFWRSSGVLRRWVEAYTWNDADFTRKLRGKSEAEKYDDLQQWLEDKEISGLTGCYCFKKEKQYIYVGRAECLSERIKQHRQKFFFTYADSVRIIIPKYKTQVGKLERLLILQHDPTENGNLGESGRNPADNCFDFIKAEIQQLLVDF